MKKVQILMSTFNGEKYLQEQLNSLFNQENIKLDILVRDDNSTDKTKEILDRNHIKWYTGKNLKPAKSFFDLIKKSGDFEYYAFCDQDDVWDNKKLYIAIKKLEKCNNNKPSMYFSNKKIVDQNLNYLYTTNETKKISLGSSLITNIATGCTIVINKKMMEALKKYSPSFIEMHDAWVYKLCLALDGNVVFDKNSYINYRQHQNNVIGNSESILSKIKRRLKGIIKCNHIKEKMALEILEGYKDVISQKNLEILNDFIDYKKLKNKFKLIFKEEYKTGDFSKDLIFKIAVLINKI